MPQSLAAGSRADWSTNQQLAAYPNYQFNRLEPIASFVLNIPCERCDSAVQALSLWVDKIDRLGPGADKLVIRGSCDRGHSQPRGQ